MKPDRRQGTGYSAEHPRPSWSIPLSVAFLAVSVFFTVFFAVTWPGGVVGLLGTVAFFILAEMAYRPSPWVRSWTRWRQRARAKTK